MHSAVSDNYFHGMFVFVCVCVCVCVRVCVCVVCMHPLHCLFVCFC